MLFLHNFEKAVMWFLMVMRATRSLLSILTKPIAGPVMELVELILPIWNICLDTVESLVSIICLVMGSSCSLIVDIPQIIVWPFWLVFSAIRSIGMMLAILHLLWCDLIISSLTCVMSVFCYSNLCYMPYNLGPLGNYDSSFSLGPCNGNSCGGGFGQHLFFDQENLVVYWKHVSICICIWTNCGCLTAYESSMSQSLWNDLFSQVRGLYGNDMCMTINAHYIRIYYSFLSFRFSVHFEAFCTVLLPSSQPPPEVCNLYLKKKKKKFNVMISILVLFCDLNMIVL